MICQVDDHICVLQYRIKSKKVYLADKYLDEAHPLQVCTIHNDALIK